MTRDFWVNGVESVELYLKIYFWYIENVFRGSFFSPTKKILCVAAKRQFCKIKFPTVLQRCRVSWIPLLFFSTWHFIAKFIGRMKIYNFEFSKSVYQFCDVIIAKWKETLNEIVGKKIPYRCLMSNKIFEIRKYYFENFCPSTFMFWDIFVATNSVKLCNNFFITLMNHKTYF